MKRKVWQTLAVTSFLYFASAAPGYAEELPLPTSAEDVAATIQDIASTVAAVPEAPPLPPVVPTVPTPDDGRPRTNPVDARKRPRKASISRPRRSISRRATDAASTPEAAVSTAVGRGTARHAGDHDRHARSRRPATPDISTENSTTSSLPSTWIWNWNWNCDPSLGASRTERDRGRNVDVELELQLHFTECAAGSGQYQDASTQYQPQNSNISIRIGSPGDNGPVTQTIAAVAQATAATVNTIAQTARADTESVGAAPATGSTVTDTAATVVQRGRDGRVGGRGRSAPRRWRLRRPSRL